MSATASHRPSFSISWRSRSRDLPDTAVLDRTDVLWVEVEAGLWVGRVEGEFTGMIELTNGGFAATDGRGVTCGVHASLAKAKRSLVPGSGVTTAWRRVTGVQRSGVTGHGAH